MSEAPHRSSLQWSIQLKVLPDSQTPALKGDRIILPPSALESLLAVARSNNRSSRSPPDIFNARVDRAFTDAYEGATSPSDALPHPLSFRLVNPANGRILYAGIREFSAEEGTIGLSSFVRKALDVKTSQENLDVGDDESPSITIHVAELRKGTFVKLRPLEAGYDVDNWKAFLEQQLRDTYTTLTSGEEIVIRAGKAVLCFLVDELKPEATAVSIVDTDLEVDIEPLSEEQARETLQKLAAKSQKGSGEIGGSSPGGRISLGGNETGQVEPGHYVDYFVEGIGLEQDLTIDLTNLDDTRDLDLFVTPFDPRHRSHARQDFYLLADMSSAASKSIKILRSSTVSEHAERLNLSIRGWSMGDEGVHQDQSPVPYNLNVSMSTSQFEDDTTNGHVETHEDEEKCSNCLQFIPKRTMFLHQNFCLRNNVLCPACRNVFQKSSQAWKNHWHCPHDSAFGNSKVSQLKHDHLSHQIQTCQLCDFEGANAADLAFHRTTVCPAKTILCQFCHLEVPQQSEEDPGQESAEVLLSGLTPHEVSDGARTTECHICARIVRLRDMAVHLKNHDLQRLSRSKPRICRNTICARTLDHVERSGDVHYQQTNELGLCDACFGPLYVSQYDPEGKAIRRRVERKYLGQLLTGCNQAWCFNDYCRTGRKNKSISETPVSSKEAGSLIKPLLDRLQDITVPFHLCTDEANQRRRIMADLLSAEAAEVRESTSGPIKESIAKGGHELEWCIAALQQEEGDLDRARAWLQNVAPQRNEMKR